MSILLSVVALLLCAPGTAGWAETNPDGSKPTLQDAITEAAKAYADAQDRLTAAKQKQTAFATELAQTNLTLTRLKAQAGQIAAAAYQAQSIAQLNALLNSTSPEDLLNRLTSLRMYLREQSLVLADLKATQQRAAEQQAAIAHEVAVAAAQTAQLAAQRQKLLKILNNATGGPSGIVLVAPTAVPSPRNSDGSWPAQGCTQNDPTTTGCLTTRTLHAYQEVKKAGFDHFVSCFRHQSWGEHPKGRACDWAAQKSGFGGAATGADRVYGNRLAGWLISNSDRLGVLYVIWYKQIWLPGIGWHRYTTEGGNPSGDHTNHVHMSIR